MDITDFTQERKAEAMVEEHEEGSPEKSFTAYDYFGLGERIARHFRGCSNVEYVRKSGDLLFDLAAGVQTLADSAAHVRAWRDSLPEGQLKYLADLALKLSDPEEATRYVIRRDRRLARAVLESCWNEEVLEQGIQERQARDPLSPEG